MTSTQGPASGTGEVEPLTIDDLPRLIPSGNPRIETADMRAILASSPHRSFWVPDTGEFVLVAPWRHRAELPSVHTLWAFRSDGPLVRAAARAAAEVGAAGLVMLETGERRRPEFYQRNGFRRIEGIRTYEHIEPQVLARQFDPRTQAFVRVTLDQPALVTAVMQIDHEAFPWFWWNSAEEFDTYLHMPEVEVWAGVRDDAVVSYIGLTGYHQWAHLDRIAVATGQQGRGIGRSAVAFAGRRAIAEGARHLGLSTQAGNRISRHLYESLGFRHTRQADYDVFGVVLDPGRLFAGAGSAPEARKG